MITKITKLFKIIFLNERNILIGIIILILFNFISYYFEINSLKELIDYFSKILIIFGLFGIYESLAKLDKNKIIYQNKIEKMIEQEKKLTESIKKLEYESINLIIDLRKHITLDLKRDAEFISIMKKIEKIFSGESIKVQKFKRKRKIYEKIYDIEKQSLENTYKQL